MWMAQGTTALSSLRSAVRSEVKQRPLSLLTPRELLPRIEWMRSRAPPPVRSEALEVHEHAASHPLSAVGPLVGVSLPRPCRAPWRARRRGGGDPGSLGVV